MNNLEKKIMLTSMNPEIVKDEISNFIVFNSQIHNYNGGVIGLSGGVDSTVSAAIAKFGYDKYNKKNPDNKLELVGYILPSDVNNPKDEEDGKMVAEKLGIRYEVLPIKPIVEAFKLTNPEAFEEKYHKGNMTSRIRANVLATKAATEGKTIIGTGNRDEDFGIGYYTLFGDGAVYISPIGNLPKRLVKEMAQYLGFSNISNRVPTAGLEPGQTDFKDLGYSYDFVELMSEGIIQGIDKKRLKDHPQIVECASNEIKSYENMYGKSKFDNHIDMVNDMLKRNEVAKVKAKIMNPEIANITLSYR